MARCNNIGSVGTNKRGVAVGHVHQRAVTSGSLPADLDRCAYKEVQAARDGEVQIYSTGANLPVQQLTSMVRFGIFLPGWVNAADSNLTLPELQGRITNFLAAQPDPSFWQSGC